MTTAIIIKVKITAAGDGSFAGGRVGGGGGVALLFGELAVVDVGWGLGLGKSTCFLLIFIFGDSCVPFSSFAVSKVTLLYRLIGDSLNGVAVLNNATPFWSAISSNASFHVLSLGQFFNVSLLQANKNSLVNLLVPCSRNTDNNSSNLSES